VLWIVRTGNPWRDLPEIFGNWNTVFERFRHCVKADVFKSIFDLLSGDPDLEFTMKDDTIVKLHCHGQGAKGGLKARPSASPAAAGQPRSSPWPTQLGNLVRFELLPGQRYDAVGVAPLIEGVTFGGLIADKAFDANWIVAELDERGAQVVISSIRGGQGPARSTLTSTGGAT
jgi:hypothetical protein